MVRSELEAYVKTYAKARLIIGSSAALWRRLPLPSIASHNPPPRAETGRAGRVHAPRPRAVTAAAGQDKPLLDHLGYAPRALLHVTNGRRRPELGTSPSTRVGVGIGGGRQGVDGNAASRVNTRAAASLRLPAAPRIRAAAGAPEEYP
jgi:hypothetical protein